MADAIVRTLWRRYVSHENLLEWETMAQSEIVAGPPFRTFRTVSLRVIAGVAAFPFSGRSASRFWCPLVCALWITAPLVAGWLNEPLPKSAAITPKDRDFLRETALRTWRYFADHSWAEHHWLVPDNVQENPSAGNAPYFPHQSRAVAHGAAGGPRFRLLEPGRVVEFGVERILHSLEEMPRYRGHFFNWYETRDAAAAYSAAMCPR